jgi:hypothetical protein
MWSPLSFTVEHFLLFEATLLSLACFTSAQSITSSNLSISCAGCAIVAPPTVLSYPSEVSETETSLSVTVIPYITVYENGNVTNWSTYTVYNSASSDGGLAPPAPSLTWETLGTTLTYPTTYIAFDDISAGASRRGGSGCTRSLEDVTLQPADQARLIFPTSRGVAIADITNSAKAVWNTLPALTELVAPLAPASCSVVTNADLLGGPLSTRTAAGVPPLTTATEATSAAAVVLTSVRYLTTKGQDVIIRRTGNAPPQQQSTPANGGQGGDNNSPPGPTITWGRSTYTGKPGGGWNFGGGDITPGGPAQTIDGTTISVAPGGSVVFNGQTTTAGAAQSSGPAQANVGADGQVPGSSVTMIAGGAIAILAGFVGIYL